MDIKTLSEAHRKIRYYRPLTECETALKHWMFGLAYLGYLPKEETIEEIFVCFMRFIAGDRKYYSFNTLTARYLEHFGFVVDYDDSWYEIYSPMYEVPDKERVD